MKKQILIVIDSLRPGGIRTSLLNFLNNLDLSLYDLTLFCFHMNEEDIKLMPEKIKIKKGNIFLNIAAMTSKEARQTNIFVYFLRKVLACLCVLLNSNRLFNVLFKLSKNKLSADIAISYTNNVGDHSLYFGANKFVLECVQAEKKITWIHADYEKMNLNSKINNNEYEKFDLIVSVSKSTKESFLRYNDSLREKCIVIYNLIDEKKLNIDKNKLIVKKNENTFEIISICRLDKNKAPDVIIDICEKLYLMKLNFRWRIIGDGPLFKQISNSIIERNLENKVELMGYIDNPYPYLNTSDLYVSTSKSEGYSMALAEALYLKIPSLSGWYESIEEAIDDNALVVKNETDAFVSAISDIMNDKNKYEKLKSKTRLLKSNEMILKEVNEILCY